MTIDFEKYFEGLKKVSRKEQKLQTAVMTGDPKLKPMFLNSLKVSLVDLKEAKLLLKDQFVQMASQFYAARFKIKKQVSLDKHFKIFLNQVLQQVTLYELQFQEGPSIELVVYPAQLV